MKSPVRQPGCNSMFKLSFKKIFALDFLNHSVLLVILLIYISISHVFLPTFHRDDFLFFSKWNRMWVEPKKFTYDITWDEGKTFLFREYRQQAQHEGINIRWLFYIVGGYLPREEIKKHFYSKLMDFCKCQKLEIFKLQGSLSDHIIYKKLLKTVTKESL